jgi:hypothetical protein
VVFLPLKESSMAHVWLEDHEQRWVVARLDRDRYGLSWRGLVDEERYAPENKSSSCAALRRRVVGSRDRWSLLVSPDLMVRLNGVLVALGIASLRDRDAILVCDPRGAGRRFFFSTEELAEIKPFRGLADVCCPRCKEKIEPDTPAVQCPLCGVWHHERDGRRCWTYAPHCAACHNQPTSLNAGFRWTPTEL